jgi:hypothetical protein
MFLIGCGYFHPQWIEQLNQHAHLQGPILWVALIVTSYAIGVIAGNCFSAPVILGSIVLGVLADIVTHIVLSLRDKSHSFRPSVRPSFRRAATVVLGGAMVPQDPLINAALFGEKIISWINEHFVQESQKEQAAQILKQGQAPLALEATKIFQEDFEKQWEEIHRTLHHLQGPEVAQTKTKAIVSMELPLSLAGVIFSWYVLSFPVPHVLLTLAFIITGTLSVLVCFHGYFLLENYINGNSVQAFLFQHHLGKKDEVASPDQGQK